MSDIETRIEGLLSQNYQVGSKEYWQARAEAAEASLAECEEKSDQRLKVALEWKRSRDDYYERLDIAKARAEAAEKRVEELEARGFNEQHGRLMP